MAEIQAVKISPTLITAIYDDGYQRIINRKHADRIDDLSRVLFHLGNDPGNPLDRSDVPSGQTNKKISPGRVLEAVGNMTSGQKANLFASLSKAHEDYCGQSEGPCIREGRLDRT